MIASVKDRHTKMQLKHPHMKIIIDMKKKILKEGEHSQKESLVTVKADQEL